MCTSEKRGKIFILVITSAGDHRLNPTLIDEIRSALRQIRADTTISSGAALITTAEGKFFSNGYDLAWAGSSQSRAQIMDSKLRSLVADLISLPMPTIAAVTGHASAAGCILALSHDYVLMRKDRGFLYVSEVDIGLIIQAWFVAVLKSKIGRPMVMRDVALRADKVTATVAVEKGIIDSAHDSAEETVKAAVKLAEDLTMRKWNGHVYAQNRIKVFSEVLDVIRNSTSKL